MAKRPVRPSRLEQTTPRLRAPNRTNHKPAQPSPTLSKPKPNATKPSRTARNPPKPATTANPFRNPQQPAITRALKLWMVLRMYGAESLRALVRHHVAMAGWLAAAVAADPRFELAAPPRLGLVCFRLAGADNGANRRLLDAVNASGAGGLFCGALYRGGSFAGPFLWELVQAPCGGFFVGAF